MFEFKAKPKHVELHQRKHLNKGGKPISLMKERAYVLKQEKIAKHKILQRKIDEFKKSKDTNPYDIKIENKFRVPANLSFFLNDQKILAGANKKDAKMQVDAFDQNSRFLLLKSKKSTQQGNEGFKQKKTGRDEGVQIELDELFDFNKAVEPIANLLITKILEQSLLEVEEEVEISNMLKIKEAYMNKIVDKEQSELRSFMAKEKAKRANMIELSKKNEESKEKMQRMEVKELCSVAVDDIVEVVCDIIGYLEEEKERNKPCPHMVKYHKTAKDIVSDRVGDKIEERNKFYSDFSKIFASEHFVNMDKRICEKMTQQRQDDLCKD